MKIRFTCRHVVALGEGKSLVYNAGDEVTLDGVVNETYARKYIRRGWAEEIIPDPLDLDGNGKMGGSKPAAPTDGVKPVADLLAALDADPPMNFFTFKAEAKKILGDETPANRDGIVATLQALLPPPAPPEGGEGSDTETPAAE